MRKQLRYTCVVGAVGIFAAGALTGVPVQAEPVAASGQVASEQSEATVQTPLKVTVVITRHQGEREVARLPYELSVYPGRQTSLSMQLEVPVPTGAISPSGQATSYQYRRAGTSITAGATDLGGGRFQIQLTVDESRVVEPAAGTGNQGALSRFSSFQSSTPLLLTDGQTLQFTAATDPVSGEVARIAVTLNVIK